MRIKICGITVPEQAAAIAQMGVTTLGLMCVPTSPRYVTSTQIIAIVKHLSVEVDRIGVFANATVEEICQTVAETALSGVQLHGDESAEFCQQLRQSLPEVEIIKALRVRSKAVLGQVEIYAPWVNTLLLDAYHPQMLGGTGTTIDWSTLQNFHSSRPWLLAGGLTPDNVLDALSQVQPNGIDLSSGVELAPGNKDLNKVAKLLEKLRIGNR